MKNFTLIALLAFCFTTCLNAQCTSTVIPKTAWTIQSFTSEEPTGEGATNGHAIHCIDNNTSTFWHSQWQATSAPYPHEIVINLGQVYPVDGLSITSRNDNNGAKAKAYDIFFSTDGATWSTSQSSGEFQYPNLNANGQTASLTFGAVNTRYIKIRMTSNYSNNQSVAISEVSATQLTGSGCVATGQNNQSISFSSIPKKYTTDTPVTLSATSNTGLPIVYSIVSGPATVSGNTLTLNGTAGTVIVKARQNGDATYYPAEFTRTFDVVDLSLINPEVFSRLTNLKTIQMPILRAYQLYANATIAESPALSVSNIQFFVDGVLQTTTFSNNSYKCLWTPASYGNHLVEIKATGSNGNITTKSVTVNVVSAVSTVSTPTFQNAVIDWGTIGSQWYYGTYTLPQSVGAFNSIVANLSVTCPSVAGGCDDWDRLAWVQIKNPDGQWVELFRYITPYGVACNHSIDVTDYESLLQGEVEFRMYIETWGTGGWKMNLNLNYTQGVPAFLYSSVEEVWQGNYNFGDPANLQPVPAKTITVPTNTTNMKFRLVTTGHGWGSNNTGNAAEFYNATHNLKINSTVSLAQTLWTDCDPNPNGCTGQAGTWQYSRAGWCPGAISAPYFFNLNMYIGLSPFNFSYVFKNTYTDLCHPNNPGCVSGTTCPDCNDGYNPYYRVGGYMIYKGSLPIQTLGLNQFQMNENNNFSVYPNSNNGIFQINMENDLHDLVVNIFTLNGQSIKTYHFKDKKQLNDFIFNLNTVSKGTYFVKIYNQEVSYSTKVLIN